MSVACFFLKKNLNLLDRYSKERVKNLNKLVDTNNEFKKRA